MREELDKALCENYPRMFQNRNKSMQESCMFWGFECGDGWYKIIDALCYQIQNHVEWKRKQRVGDLLRMRAAKKGRDALIKFLAGDGQVRDWHEERADEILENGDRPITPYCHHVVVDQVKEKFGGLRFYCRGGDEATRGMIRMAEAWASVTCEVCGNPGTPTSSGWIKTLCEVHKKEREERYKSA